MEHTLKQVGELLLGAVPTILLLLMLYGLYTALVYKPLKKVLAERRSRTEGAIEKARADISAAESKTFEYEAKLREAKLTVFRAQEARRQQAQDARAEAVAEARKRADALIQQAKKQVQEDAGRPSRDCKRKPNGWLRRLSVRCFSLPAEPRLGRQADNHEFPDQNIDTNIVLVLAAGRDHGGPRGADADARRREVRSESRARRFESRHSGRQ